MKRTLRTIASTLLIITGVSMAGWSVYTLFYVRDFATVTVVLSALLAGTATILAGIAVARGASIRDILHDLLSAIYLQP